jgi:RHH-type proline utilization regulon transcriptional repressor/proline dehydrogenase/delta 1-pyrroline-5-carboxylate dehydrogenase
LTHLSKPNLVKRLADGKIKRMRLLKQPATELQKALAEAACHINFGQPLLNGRLELLQFLREISVSRDYHRYGNLGERENEKRAPLPKSAQEENTNAPCQKCDCHG